MAFSLIMDPSFAGPLPFARRSGFIHFNMTYAGAKDKDGPAIGTGAATGRHSQCGGDLPRATPWISPHGRRGRSKRCCYGGGTADQPRNSA